MKITEGMIEAGAAAYVKVKGQSPESIVATVFSAMTQRFEVEEGQRRNPAAEKKPYVHQSWPAWRYPPDGGQGRIFQSAEEVPEGWTNRPQTLAQSVAAEVPPTVARKVRKAA